MPRPGRPKQADLMAMKAKEPEDARRMFEMRIKGMTLAAIAAAFKTSTKRVHVLLEKYSKMELEPYVEEYRQLQVQRMEYLWEKLVTSGRLEKGDPAAFNAGNAILKRMAEHFGTDAPTKLEMNMKIDPKEIELRSMIEAARAKARQEILAIKGEAADDIVEAEIIDDEEDDE